MIKKLSAYDFDGTLIDSPEKEAGKAQWAKMKKVQYPHLGWWGRPESLDLNVFDIKPFPDVLDRLKQDVANPETYVIVLTSRMEKLRPQVEAVLKKNGIRVDKVDMRKDQRSKGRKIFDYLKNFPDLEEVDVHDDRESDIMSFKQIEPLMPENITYRIFQAERGLLKQMEEDVNLFNIIQEEVKGFIKK